MIRKLVRSLFGIAFAALLAFAPALSARAEIIKPEDAFKGYDYTVRFLSGAQGTFTSDGVKVYSAGKSVSGISKTLSPDGSVITVSGIPYGSRVSFSTNCVTLSDGAKYYVKGIRESGMDNNTISANFFEVTSDLEYVVGYGLIADSVAYTVEYKDNRGNTLLPSVTHYGNVGDRPVIAFVEIDGYVPQAYNLTGTLFADAKDNVFTFRYTPLAELPDYYRGYTYNGVTGEGGIIVIPGNGGGNGGGGGGANGAPNGADGDGGIGVNPGEGEETINPETTPAAPVEILDIRDEEAALSDGEGIFGGALDNMEISTESPTAFFTSIPVGAKIGIVGGLAAAVGTAAYFLFIRRGIKSKDEDE